MQNLNYRRATFKRLHYISGLTLSFFIAFHLLNHLYSVQGPESHIAVMEKFRLVYRHPVIETFLLAVTFFQIVSGLRLVYQRQPTSTVEKIQVYSGLYLSFFLLAHVTAVLSGRYLEQLDTNFYYAAAGLNVYPATFIFIPYYFLAVASISLHVASIHYLKTGVAGIAIAIGSVGILTSFVIILGFTNFFQWFDMPEIYDHFIRNYF